MGRRYVEVFQAKRSDYYLAASLRLKSEHMYPTPGYGMGGGSHSNHMIPSHRGPRMAPTEHTGVIKMRGLPFNVTPEDIAQFFRGVLNL